MPERLVPWGGQPERQSSGLCGLSINAKCHRGEGRSAGRSRLAIEDQA